MFRVKGKAILGSCLLLLGLAIGSLRVSSFSPRSKGIFRADFCSILQNPGIIGSNRFITFATITSIQPHGLALSSPACPELGSSFSEELDRQDLAEALGRRLQKEPYTPVPVVFEGNLRQIRLAQRLLQMAASKLGLRVDMPEPIVVKAYVEVGEVKRDSALQTCTGFPAGGPF